MCDGKASDKMLLVQCTMYSREKRIDFVLVEIYKYEAEDTALDIGKWQVATMATTLHMYFSAYRETIH